MAEFIEDVNENELLTSSLDDLATEKEIVEKAPEPEDDLPEKYRGKTAKEIIAMHQEAEKLIGRQGSEVGELRKVVDEFIKTQTSKNSKTQEVEPEEIDFFADPDKAVKSVVDRHPDVKAAREATLQMKRDATLNKIAKKFPDFESTVQDPAFAEWITSSKVRVELYGRAETQFDYDSAEELLSAWEERKQRTKAITETSKADREQSLKAADVGSQGSSEPASKKKYRRSDIIKLMQTDPDRYDSMQDEIQRAYREGRVI